jgi:hypothetical protein
MVMATQMLKALNPPVNVALPKDTLDSHCLMLAEHYLGKEKSSFLLKKTYGFLTGSL